MATKAEIVERFLDTWRKLDSIPSELMQPDIEWVNPPDAIETGTRHGEASFREAESAFQRAYSSFEIEVGRQVERGNVVGLIVKTLVRGRGSGIELRQRQGMAFTISDGKVARFEWSNDPEELLARTVNAESDDDPDG
jgi:ketosteroid isomerase-like protein